MASHHPWTKPYRDVVEQQYLLDAPAQQAFDAFFARVDEMAGGCGDQGAFVSEFLKSPLYSEYNQLLGKYMHLAKSSTGQTLEDTAESLRRESDEISAKEHAKTMAEQKLNEVVSQMLPPEINQLRWGGVRTLPVIGPVIQWINNLKFLRNMFGKK